MTRQNYKILSILSVLLSVYYPIVIGRLHVPVYDGLPLHINLCEQNTLSSRCILMGHGASSPGSSRNVVRTHLGGPLDCSVYKVMFFNKFSGLLCPGPWFGNKIFFNKHDKRVNYPLPQPPQIVWIELNWIQSNDFCHEASNNVRILGGNIFFLSVACSEVEHDCVHKSPPSTPPHSLFEWDQTC